MQAEATTTPRRRTQGQRSAATRQAVLFAARDAISDLGYSRSGHGNPEMKMLLNLTLSLLRGMAFHRSIDDENQEYYDDLLKAWSSIVKRIVGKESLHGIKII